jgi:hypothetical protein
MTPELAEIIPQVRVFRVSQPAAATKIRSTENAAELNMAGSSVGWYHCNRGGRSRPPLGWLVTGQ